MENITEEMVGRDIQQPNAKPTTPKYARCGWQGPLSEWHSHKNIFCPLESIACPYCDYQEHYHRHELILHVLQRHVMKEMSDLQRIEETRDENAQQRDMTQKGTNVVLGQLAKSLLDWNKVMVANHTNKDDICMTEEQYVKPLPLPPPDQRLPGHVSPLVLLNRTVVQCRHAKNEYAQHGTKVLVKPSEGEQQTVRTFSGSTATNLSEQ